MRWRNTIQGLVCSTAACVWAATAQAALPDNFSPTDYAKPDVCEKNFEYNGTAGTCTVAAALNATAAACVAAKFTHANGVCTATPAQTADASCRTVSGFAATIKGNGITATCEYARTNAVSANSDYIGDCFTIKTVPPGSSLSQATVTKPKDGKYIVTAQRVLPGEDDRELTLVQGDWQLLPPSLCVANPWGKGTHTIRASQLGAAGATRRGWTYGFLTMPYKYYPSTKSFEVNLPWAPTWARAWVKRAVAGPLRRP